MAQETVIDPITALTIKTITLPNFVPIKVLYIHHVGLLGGSSRSLYEMLRGFPDGAVQAHLLGPRGLFPEMLSVIGVPTEHCLGITQFDNCAYSHYRGLRWLILLRELFLLAPTLWGLKKARTRWGRFDIVHVNDFTMPFAAWAAKRLFPESRLIVHARAVQCTRNNYRKYLLQRLYARSADSVIAINQNVAESLPVGLPLRIIHNGMIAPAGTEITHKKSCSSFSVAMVGVLSRSKGCLDFVEAARICCARGYQFRFLLIGGRLRATKGWRDPLLKWLGLKEDIGPEIEERIKSYGLDDVVVFRPFTSDLESVYREIDVLCFPSFLDAPGRPIFEAGFFGIPSIAAINNPKPDTFIDGETGLRVSPGSPEALSELIIELYRDPDKRHRLGTSARKMSLERFDAFNNAQHILALYMDLLSDRTFDK